MAITLIIIYTTFMFFILGYSLVQANLIYHYLQAHNRKWKNTADEHSGFRPNVTIQLPIYNELYVVERLIDTTCAIEYPLEKLEIQVLDDSTDESVEITARKVAEWKAKGINIKHIRRPIREGYKAGALKYGLEIADGEYVAIFDADFVPETDFLLKTIPHFQNPKVGMVQTRWDHMNRTYSLLTKAQAFGLDAHFTIEQKGRNSAGFFITFNGTSGVWRKECILDAGNWQSDTITEDMDLSYRAQLKGWKFIYLEDVSSPAELPVTMDAYKSQQFRWNKGAAECTKKNLLKVWRTPGVSLGEKIHAAFHMLGNFNFVAIVVTAIISVPLLIIKSEHPEYRLFFQLASVFVLGFFILGFYYWISNKRDSIHKEMNVAEFFVDFIFFLSVSMGMSLHNAIAFIAGLMGFKSSFIRTPKFNLALKDASWAKNKYTSKGIKPLTILEGLMVCYFLWALYLAFKLKDFGLVPFHGMLLFGYCYVFFMSLSQSVAISFSKG